MSNYISIPPYTKEWFRFRCKIIRNRPWVVRDFSLHDKRFNEKVAERWAYQEILRRKKLFPDVDPHIILEETSVDFYNLWRNAKAKGAIQYQYSVANDFLIYILNEVI